MHTFTASLVGVSLFLGAGSLHVATPGAKLNQSRDEGAREDLGGVVGAPGESGPDMVTMGGVPVFGYGRGVDYARKTGSFSSMNGTAHNYAEVKWIVMFTSSITEEQLDDLCDNFFVPCTDHGDRTHPDRLGLPYLITTCTGAQLNETLAKVAATLPGITTEYVEHGEPISIDEADMQVTDVIGDGLVESFAARGSKATIELWGLARIGKDQAPAAGAGVHAYILDTGVMFEHNDFGGRAVPAIESLGSVKICECSNTSCATDTYGHGTFMAAKIAGSAVGVAPQARIHSVKIFTAAMYSDSSYLLTALSWILTYGMKPAVLTLPHVQYGPSVHNAVLAAVTALTDAGMVVVTGAGQYPYDACFFFPSFVPSAITVGAVDVNDAHYAAGNYGTCVDIYAPGVSVWSAWITSVAAAGRGSSTGMAAAYVAGGAAILLSLNPAMTVAQVTAELLAKAESGAITGVPANTPNLLLQVGTLSGTV